MKRKKICVSLPCYNEEENVEELASELVRLFESQLKEYDYELQFIDNCSTDNTQKILRYLCEKNQHIKAIFNTKNWGTHSGFYGALQAKGDCTICMATDFQTPSSMIPLFVEEWEKGACIVGGVKNKSDESLCRFGLRTLYYKALSRFSSFDIIENFTGFGLYDKKFMDFLRTLQDPLPTMRGMVAEFGYDIVLLPFKQPKRKHGKSRHNLFSIYNLGIRWFIAYTKIGVRASVILGMLLFLVQIIMLGTFFVAKVGFDNNIIWINPQICILLLISSLHLMFIGVLGEYVLNIQQRIMKRPLVVEKERINFTSVLEKGEND